MPGLLVHVGATIICPHGGLVRINPRNTRVLVSGQPVVTVNDEASVSNCKFTVPVGKLQPCVKVQWLTPATRVRVNGQAVILQSTIGLCFSPEQIPQAMPIVTMTQLRVSGV